jgi:hypothetical protein
LFKVMTELQRLRHGQQGRLTGAAARGALEPVVVTTAIKIM